MIFTHVSVAHEVFWAMFGVVCVFASTFPMQLVPFCMLFLRVIMSDSPFMETVAFPFPVVGAYLNLDGK